ncbi:hypothetical protein BZA05DRAFT_452927, partial [Tricharina praecox]|uniref:uncharacterized protein n=1 Tax=Tricharina praecox TaxID=43433 RepID=UPI00221F0DE5
GRTTAAFPEETRHTPPSFYPYTPRPIFYGPSSSSPPTSSDPPCLCCCLGPRHPKGDPQFATDRRDCCIWRLLAHRHGIIVMHLILFLLSLIAYGLFFGAMFWDDFDTGRSTNGSYYDEDCANRARGIMILAAIVLWIVTVGIWIWLCVWNAIRRRRAARAAAKCEVPMQTQQQQQQQVRPSGLVSAHAGADGAADWATNWSSDSERIWAGGREGGKPAVPTQV